MGDREFKQLVHYITLRQKLEKAFTNIPEIDYGTAKSKIEKLVTIQMTYQLDKQVIDFAENNKGTAASLRKIIQKKQKFPRDEFAKLRESFPCILAGIRDYAEYIPLQPEVFDLVIIDEASQVSIAQAFPALLRAKKVLNPPDDFEEFCQSRFEVFEGHLQNGVERVTERLKDVLQELQRQGKEIEGSDLTVAVRNRIESSDSLKQLFGVIGTGTGMQEFDGTGVFLKDIRDKLKSQSQLNPDGLKIPFNFADSLLSSTNIFDASSKLLSKVDKDAVLKVGHALGKKFKPWEAVKLTSKFTKAVPILNVVSAIWEVYSKIRDDKKKVESNLKLSQFKTEIRTLLEDAVTNTAMELSGNLFDPITIMLEEARTMLVQKRAEMVSIAGQNQQGGIELDDMRSECLALYDVIYQIDQCSNKCT